jgi:hypothetical protein
MNTALPHATTLPLSAVSEARTLQMAPVEPSPAERVSFPVIADAWFVDVDADSFDRCTSETRKTVRLVVPRPPRARLAVLLALAVLLVPMCAPLCWRFAEDELRAIAAGGAHGASRTLHVAAMWGAFVTFLGIGFMLAYPLGLLL